jgi:ankyrin repeat protein
MTEININKAFYYCDKSEKSEFFSKSPKQGWDMEWHNAEQSGFTALTRAASNNDADILKLLIDKNGNIEARDDHDATPLMRAASNGMLDTTRMLVDYGAILDAQDKWGWTPLMWAAAYGQYETLKLLLNRGADINIKNTVGETACMLATTEKIKVEMMSKASMAATKRK